MGSVQGWPLSWLIVVGVGLSPILAFFVSLVIGRLARRKQGQHPREDAPDGSGEGDRRHESVEAPPR
jgi:hypothetical protein